MTEDTSQRTMHAQEAFQFVDIFGFKFSRVQYGADTKRKLRLAEPEMSTDGGRKARQPITLITDDETGRALVCGWIDVPRKVAELRSFNNVSQQFEARYGAEIDMAREEYERALSELQVFFKAQKVESKLIEAPPAQAVATNAARPRANAALPNALSMSVMLTLIAFGVAIGFILGYLVFGL